MRQLGKTRPGTVAQIKRLHDEHVIKLDEGILQRYRRLKTREKVRETSAFLHPNTPEDSLELHGFLIRGDRSSNKRRIRLTDRHSDPSIRLPSIYAGSSETATQKHDGDHEVLSKAIVQISPRLSMANSFGNQSGLFSSEGNNEGLLYAVQNPSLHGRGSRAFSVLNALRTSLKKSGEETPRAPIIGDTTESDELSAEARGLKKLKKGKVLQRVSRFKPLPSAAILKGFSVKQ